MKEPVYLSLKNATWHYKGEGNSNLVISLSKEKIIIRFLKTDGEHNNKCSDNEKAWREVEFWRRILIPHFGKDYLKPPLLGVISELEVMELNDHLRAYRPRARMKKYLQSGFVTIYPDYTYVSSNFPHFRSVEIHPVPSLSINSFQGLSFCVEIKPKQGWLHPADRFRMCTFCLNQFLKLEKGVVSQKSEYCPLELFSGNKTRMVNALRSLLRTPQNNLKIFQDGHVVFSDSSNSSYLEVLRRWLDPDSPEFFDENRLVEKWCNLVYNALTKDLNQSDLHELFYFNNGVEINGSTCNRDRFTKDTLSCDWSAEPLPPNCVLNRILMLQKLQNLSFKSVYQAYRDLPKDFGDYYYVDELLKSNRCLGLIERYLIAATAKDCSVLIAFQPTSEREVIEKMSTNCLEDIDGGLHLFNIGVLDLDPKPVSCILKHYNRDLNMLAAFSCHQSNISNDR